MPTTKSHDQRQILLCRLEFARRMRKTSVMAESLSALIIDDERHMRLYFSTLLKAVGVGIVWEADSGPRGKQIYLRHKPAIVLLDLNMAGPRGVETLAQLIESDPHARVIIVTSQNDRETVLECERLGATGFLLKTRPKDELVAALKEFLSEASKARDSG